MRQFSAQCCTSVSSLWCYHVQSRDVFDAPFLFVVFVTAADFRTVAHLCVVFMA
jgi:hypothetical protein